MASEVVPFQLVAGDVALDFVNTLDNRFAPEGPTELLMTYGDLVRFGVETGVVDRTLSHPLIAIPRGDEQESALLAAIDLREALAAVLYGIVNRKWVEDRHRKRLEKIFRKALTERRMFWGHLGDGPAAWWSGVGPEAFLPVWGIALAAERLLTSRDQERLRACEVESCRWLFLDKTKNYSRRWCDMKVCGNRMKAVRFKARG